MKNKDKGFNHPVYAKFFGNLINVRTVPQKSHDKKDERRFVHYPLAKEIAIGSLSQFDGFDSYTNENVFVLCNLRINVPQDGNKKIRTWYKKNPDILALTSNSEITAIECKNEAKFDKKEIERMAMTFITIKDFAGPFPLSDRGSMVKDGWNKWAFIYRRCYEKDSRFSTLQASLNELFLIKNFEEKQYWAKRVMEYIKSSKFRYIIAFAGPPYRRAIQGLIKEFELKIGKYDSALSGFSEKPLFLSIADTGKLLNLSSAKDYLN
jgi:hypothetical protein